jgi:hypothetical protein
VPLLILAAGNSRETMAARLKSYRTEHAYSVERFGENLAQVIERIQDRDLVMVTSSGSARRYRSSLGLIPEQLAAMNKGSIAMIHFP